MNIDHPRPGQKAALQALWAEAFQDPDTYIHSFFSAAYSPRRCLCISKDKQIIAAAHWLDCSYSGGKLAYIYAVATAEAHRGQGCCRELMNGIHEALKKEGYAGAVLVPGSAALAGMYRSMGYEFFGGMEEFTCRAAPLPLPLREVSPMEYGRLRRNCLPEDGVQQAGENLRFLSQQAKLAVGEGVLLAYTQIQGELFVPELLGNVTAAPGIVRALGFEKGRFRIPGKTPFAMFHPLQDATAPGYFGFAFD